MDWFCNRVKTYAVFSVFGLALLQSSVGTSRLVVVSFTFDYTLLGYEADIVYECTVGWQDEIFVEGFFAIAPFWSDPFASDDDQEQAADDLHDKLKAILLNRYGRPEYDGELSADPKLQTKSRERELKLIKRITRWNFGKEMDLEVISYRDFVEIAYSDGELLRRIEELDRRAVETDAPQSTESQSQESSATFTISELRFRGLPLGSNCDAIEENERLRDIEGLAFPH